MTRFHRVKQCAILIAGNGGVFINIIKKYLCEFCLLAVLIIVFGWLVSHSVHMDTQYNKAVELSQSENVTYQEIEDAFRALGRYRDSYERMQLAYESRIEVEAKAEVEVARAVEEQNAIALRSARHLVAVSLFNQGLYEQAMSAFENLKPYFDSENYFLESKYRLANKLLEEGYYRQAARLYATLDDYKDSEERLFDVWVGIILEHIWLEVQENGGGSD